MIVIVKLSKEGNINYHDKFLLFTLFFWALFGFDVLLQYDAQEFAKEIERVYKEAEKKKIAESLPKN